MAIENDGIVAGPAFVVGGGGDSGFATMVTPLVTISSAEYRADVERWTGERDAD